MEPQIPKPAFPCIEEGEYGLSKREYFAAAALQGILASPNEYYMHMAFSEIAETAAKLADHLMRKLGEE